MFFPLLTLAGAAAAGPLIHRSPVAGTPGVTVSSVKPLRAFKDAIPLRETTNTVSLTRKKGISSSSRLLRAVRIGNTTVDGTYGTSDISSVTDSQILITTVQFGDQTFEAVLDTGSSDTWMAETGFDCLGQLSRAPEPESYCKFGPTYNISSTFTQIPNENFNISYGDGEFLTGIVGYEKVTLANITVEKQEVGIVNSAAWNGDGTSSGLIGLAYPGLTSVHSGNTSGADNRTNQIQYNPIFTNMYEDGQVASIFTLVIERGNDTSTLALGGLPPARPGWANLAFTSTPIEITMLTPASNPLFSTEPSYYTIQPDGFTYKNASTAYLSGNYTNPNATTISSSPVSSINATFPMIVDSGTTLIYVPTAFANTINSAFNPPAKYSPEDGVDIVPCNATAPDFGVTIGGTTFDISAEDMIVSFDSNEPGYCMSGVQDGGGAVNILGDVFLKNVIAVFDVGAGMMRFAPNENY